MSGNIVIYDKSGTSQICVDATYRQINNLVDDRFYRIEYFSKKPTALNDPYSNPIRLFVIPGGIYREMADELQPLASHIRQLVTAEGTSYLGICAGAIAALSQPLLMCDNFILSKPDPKLEMIQLPFELQKKPHLNLYSGNCSVFTVEGSGRYGTQLVKKAKTNEKPYSLFFQQGIFFPDAEKQPGVKPLLEYSSYLFSGFYLPENNGPKETYENIVPIAAVTQKVGEGQILLSGVHPEIGIDDVIKFPVDHETQEKAKIQTIISLNGSKTAQLGTMRDYLNILSIATKKV